MTEQPPEECKKCEQATDALNRIWKTIGGPGLLWDNPAQVADKVEKFFGILGEATEDAYHRAKAAEFELAKRRLWGD